MVDTSALMPCITQSCGSELTDDGCVITFMFSAVNVCVAALFHAFELWVYLCIVLLSF